MKKKIIISIAFILLIVIVISLLTPLVVPKHDTARLTGEYYSYAGDNDVIFLGDCEVYETFIPAILWEKYGISSYVRGTPQQLIWQSYYILVETLKYEKPKAVVFNVYSLKYGTPQSEENNRYTLDTMKWSKTKIDAIRASMMDDESILDYFIPFLGHHGRIIKLTGNDFKYWFKSPPVASDSGYLMNAGVEGTNEVLTVDDVPALSGKESDFSQTSLDYLDKMHKLCKDNDIELILVKAPTNSWNVYWYEEYEEQVEHYASTNGLKYYNLKECEDAIGIDWSVDTHDKGFHLNVYGAEKATEYFGKILSDECKIPNRKNDSKLSDLWSERTESYYNRKEAMKKMEENK